jgi:hypothetical protein
MFSIYRKVITLFALPCPTVCKPEAIGRGIAIRAKVERGIAIRAKVKGLQ